LRRGGSWVLGLWYKSFRLLSFLVPYFRNTYSLLATINT